MSQREGPKQASQVRQGPPQEGLRGAQDCEPPARGSPPMNRAAVIGCLVFAGLAALAGAAYGSPGIVPGSFHATALNRDGTIDITAGSHPYVYTASFVVNHDKNEVPEGSARS